MSEWDLDLVKVFVHPLSRPPLLPLLAFFLLLSRLIDIQKWRREESRGVRILSVVDERQFYWPASCPLHNWKGKDPIVFFSWKDRQTMHLPSFSFRKGTSSSRSLVFHPLETLSFVMLLSSLRKKGKVSTPKRESHVSLHPSHLTTHSSFVCPKDYPVPFHEGDFSCVNDERCVFWRKLTAWRNH